MKIFLDVGAHQGQSLEAALEYDFDKIYCFEPVIDNYQSLLNGIIYSDRGNGRQATSFKDDRVVICPFGLWSVNEQLNIHSPHTMAASVFSDHQDNEGGSILCNFVNASEWFSQNIAIHDQVIMKLNCEGAECTIIENLMRTHELRKVMNFMIDFDAYKIQSQKHVPRILLQQLLVQHYYNFVLCDNVMIGHTHFDRICNWLNVVSLSKKI